MFKSFILLTQLYECSASFLITHVLKCLELKYFVSLWDKKNEIRQYSKQSIQK